jgi:hypothetical protein
MYIPSSEELLQHVGLEAPIGACIEGGDVDVEYEVCNNSIIPIAVVELSLSYPQYLRLSRGSRGGSDSYPA